MKNIKLITFLALLLASTAYGQEKPVSNEFPLKLTGYFGLAHPVATVQNGDIKMNFDNSYNVGFVGGINFQKNPKYGYSFEVVSMVEANSQTSKVKNIVIQPGVYFPLKRGWTVTNRFSFETSGRFGLTPSVGKVLFNGKHPVTLTLPLPMRFGNDQDFSIGTAVLVTVAI